MEELVEVKSQVCRPWGGFSVLSPPLESWNIADQIQTFVSVLRLFRDCSQTDREAVHLSPRQQPSEILSLLTFMGIPYVTWWQNASFHAKIYQILWQLSKGNQDIFLEMKSLNNPHPNLPCTEMQMLGSPCNWCGASKYFIALRIFTAVCTVEPHNKSYHYKFLDA